MTPADRPRFDSLPNPPSGIGEVLRQRPGKYMMLMAHAQEILREPASLSSHEREVIAAYTSRLNGCEYCFGSHAEFALSLGASAHDIEAVRNDLIDGHPLEAILAYVRALTLAPSSITDAHKRAVHDAGFDEEQLKDAIAVCAAFNLFNRIVEGHGVPPHDNYGADVAFINKHGYDRRY